MRGGGACVLVEETTRGMMDGLSSALHLLIGVKRLAGLFPSPQIISVLSSLDCQLFPLSLSSFISGEYTHTHIHKYEHIHIHLLLRTRIFTLSFNEYSYHQCTSIYPSFSSVFWSSLPRSLHLPFACATRHTVVWSCRGLYSPPRLKSKRKLQWSMNILVVVMATRSRLVCIMHFIFILD